jgi:hypothetical protein
VSPEVIGVKKMMHRHNLYVTELVTISDAQRAKIKERTLQPRKDKTITIPREFISINAAQLIESMFDKMLIAFDQLGRICILPKSRVVTMNNESVFLSHIRIASEKGSTIYIGHLPKCGGYANGYTMSCRRNLRNEDALLAEIENDLGIGIR